MNPRPGIFISGMGLNCALGLDLKSCLESLKAGKVNTVTVEIPGYEIPLSLSYYRIPDGRELFDPSRFDTLIAKASTEAVKDAGLSRAEIAAMPIYVGSSAFDVTQCESRYADELKIKPQGSLPMPLHPVNFELVAQVARQAIGGGGDATTFNTACTAAANALLAATRALQLGRHEHALVIGVELANLTTLAGFSGLQLIAPSLKPFDLNRLGIVLGEGVGAVVLSRKPGKRKLALLAGSNNGDTHSVTTANPDGSSIARLQADALRQAGVASANVIAVKAHGTASPMNDTGEAAGMRQIFNPLPKITGLKSLIGHTLGACGVNELCLMAGAIESGFIPATAQFETVDPALNITPLRENAQAVPGKYLLNFFGFGGNNCALVLEAQP